MCRPINPQGTRKIVKRYGHGTNVATLETVNKEIDQCRKECNLPPLKRGYKRCSKCLDKFYAEDYKAQYFCQRCRTVINRMDQDGL